MKIAVKGCDKRPQLIRATRLWLQTLAHTSNIFPADGIFDKQIDF